MMVQKSTAGAVCAIALMAGTAVTLATPASAATGQPTLTHDRAGYAVTADRASRVHARWVVPTATCAADTTYATVRIALRRGAKVFWVGTTVNCSNGAASYAAVQGRESWSYRLG